MAESFAYDLIAFLRVIHTRRRWILQGTLVATVLVALASLIWPQTWRANASVFVSTPKFKQTLQLFPDNPFDVKTYEGIMRSDSLYQEILATMRWYHEATHALLDTDKINRLKENLAEKAALLTKYQLIENTNLRVLTELLAEPEPPPDTRLTARIGLLGFLDAEEIESIYRMDLSELEDWSVFDLRKCLQTHVAIIKETNLETQYSNSIQVSAESDTAVGAKLLANLWINLFMNRAEEIIQSVIKKQVIFTQDQAKRIDQMLAGAETQLKKYDVAAMLSDQRARRASKIIMLTGMKETRQTQQSTEQNFNLEDTNEPFLNRIRSQSREETYEMTPQYEQALLPKRFELDKEIALLEATIKSKAERTGASEEEQKLKRLMNERLAIDDQIQALEGEIVGLNQVIQEKETERALLERRVEESRTQWASIQPLLAEATLLESQGQNIKFADVSPDRAIKPDKRISPRRSLMTIIGFGVALVLFTALAFFQDIWRQATSSPPPK